jgi:type IV secretion system protein VirB2
MMNQINTWKVKAMKQISQQLRKMDPKALLLLTVMLFCTMFAQPAMAQTGGLSQVNTLMNLILEALQAISIAAVTIAVILTGYKMAFKGDSLGDCAPVLVGGVVIGAAGQIAQMLVGP